MTAVLASLAFLATLWMLVIVGADVFDKSGSKILMALKGQRLASAISTRPVRLRHQRYPMARAYRTSSRQRAAA